MTITINVTERDIEHGTRRCCDHCPIALAIIRRLRGEYWVKVGLVGDVEIWSYGDGGKVGFRRLSIGRLPEEQIAFIRAFDAEEPVEPHSFTFDIPEHLLREGEVAR